MNIQLQILLRGSAPDSSLLQTWEDGIENMWSKKFDVADRSFRYHINFDVSFTTEASGSIDQSVLVIDGQGSGNMFNWYTISDQGAEYNGQAAAHEFGHMLGLYDEYTSGMLDPSDFIDTTSIMGSLDGITYTRHYQAFLDWLQPAANGRKLSLTAYDPDWVNPTIPEPASAAIMTLGGLLFALKRRKR